MKNPYIVYKCWALVPWRTRRTLLCDLCNKVSSLLRYDTCFFFLLVFWFLNHTDTKTKKNKIILTFFSQPTHPYLKMSSNEKIFQKNTPFSEKGCFKNVLLLAWFYRCMPSPATKLNITLLVSGYWFMTFTKRGGGQKVLCNFAGGFQWWTGKVFIFLTLCKSLFHM